MLVSIIIDYMEHQSRGLTENAHTTSIAMTLETNQQTEISFDPLFLEASNEF